ncbi:MAG: hypothetical protein LBS70_06260 [Candidatus Accumulibacter sp.]|jgi:hypothetical protein|nr:hypothetical protein [Accumulibacter sp.]
MAGISSLRRAWVSPAGFRRADEGPPVLLSGANAPHSGFSRISPGGAKADANARRDPEVFAAAARLLMSQATRRRRQELRPRLYLLAEVRACLFQRPSLEFLARRRRSEQTRLWQQIQPELFA